MHTLSMLTSEGTPFRGIRGVSSPSGKQGINAEATKSAALTGYASPSTGKSREYGSAAGMGVRASVLYTCP